MVTHTQQIAWSIVSRQPIFDLSPTSRQPVADKSQPIFNQLAINRPPVANWLPTGHHFFRDSCRRPVADWSATEKMQFWSHSGCIGCIYILSHKAVAGRLQYMRDRGFTLMLVICQGNITINGLVLNPARKNNYMNYDVLDIITRQFLSFNGVVKVWDWKSEFTPYTLGVWWFDHAYINVNPW